MTAAQMITAFRVQYDIANLEGPGYEDEEIFVLLNQAQSIEVLKEVALRRLTYISNLIVNEGGQVADNAPYNYDKIYTPSQTYIAYLSSKILVTRANFKPTTGEEWIDTELIIKEKSGLYINNSNHHPILLKPVVYEDTTDKISVIVDRDTTISSANPNFYLEYVKKPADIATGVDSIVNSVLHDRIVNTAVDLGKKVFNPQEAGVSQQTDKIMTQPQA